uniref:Cof-type HAD-IIB family hydrolase n=1 Tax=Eubacterium cellulosolvens TaxID=29322 RepID=UPI00047FC2BA|nr:Cof-type HAD-IIB family hydrolase [[Eubacterium] cellulosolvens]
MQYKALALDLDGTLTNSNKEVSDTNKQAIHDAIREDTKIILASGRPEIGIIPVAEELDLFRLGGYILSYNGGKIVECKSGRVIRSASIPADCYPMICDACREYGITVVSYDADGIITENTDCEYLEKEERCCSCKARKVDNLLDELKEPVIKFLAMGKHEDLIPLKDYLNETLGDQINAFFSEPFFLEITAKGIEKASSLDLLNRMLGITSDELIACGDGYNDISMLRYAGMGVVMDNASDEIKQYGDYIAPSNDCDGVAHVIHRFISA